MARRRTTESSVSNRITVALLGLAVAMSGCAEDPTRPVTDAPAEETKHLGLMEITLSGIGSTGAMTATARSIGTDGGTLRGPDGAILRGSGGLQDLALYSLDRLEEDTRSGIQLEPIATSSFTYGERGNDGQRYLSATFAVRNASADSVAYTTAVNNVTLVAVATNATIGATPVSRMRRFDGTEAPAALALELRPTGAVMLDGTGALSVHTADVLQAFTETEAADLGVEAGLDNVFPYGFIVRNPDRRFDRQLAANPAAGQFDGVLTLAFRIPLAADRADDVYEISIMMLAVSDTETRVTQSFEEQTICVDDVEARAEELRATTVTLLEGGMLYDPLPTRDVAQIRTAGTAATPTATLPDAVTAAYPPSPAIFDLSDSTGVIPLIREIVRSPNPSDPANRYVIRYGYYNSGAAVTYPIGMDNFFVPGAAFRGQPTEFLPGLHLPPNGGFEVPVNASLTPVLNWSVGDRFVSAIPAELPAPPPCGYRY